MIQTHGITHYNPDDCFGCKLRTIQFGAPTFEPHFNYAVGQYVSSWSEFNEALKRASHDQTVRSGIESNYEPIHPSDMVRNAPPEKAPSLLPKLAKIDADPTISSHVDALAAARAKAKADAEREARTKDLIHADS